MSYTLEAIFSTQGTLEKFKGAYKNISIVSLPQGFEMIPLTYDLQQEMYGYEPEGTDYEDDDIGVPAAALANLVEQNSKNARVAYIQISCWGGDCGHGFTVWENGKIILGPSRTLSGEMYRPRIPLSETGANKALRAIGVQVTDLDEFQSLGLQKYRHTDAWVEIEKSTL